MNIKNNKKQGERKMKGIILAGGNATRLYPLTHTTSKQLLPVFDKQMIFYPLNTLIKGGIKDIQIIVAPEHCGQYLILLGSIFKGFGINISFEVQKVPKGLAEAFDIGASHIGDDNVTMVLGDNIFEDDFSDVIKNFKSGGHVFAKKVDDPERFGVVRFDDSGKAVEIKEKPKKWISDYAVTGLYIYDNRVVDVAKSITPSDRGEVEITDINRYYLEEGELEVSTFEGEWLDAGTHESLLKANNIVRDKGIYKDTHPIINKAIEIFNEEMKAVAKMKLGI